MSNPRPMMTDAEIDFLARHIKPTDRVFEWGSGESTLWLASRANRVTSVEHDSRWAASVILRAPNNVSVLYCPTDLPWAEGEEEDGDRSTFARYVEAYDGRGVDVVVIDGRARVQCAREVVEGIYGPHPGMRVFLHDADRTEYKRIWWDDPEQWGDSLLVPVERIGELLLMKARL